MKLANQETIIRRKIEYSVNDPHSARERFEGDFSLVLHCMSCGRMGKALKKDISAAIREHIERHHKATDTGVAVMIHYPKQ